MFVDISKFYSTTGGRSYMKIQQVAINFYQGYQGSSDEVDFS